MKRKQVFSRFFLLAMLMLLALMLAACGSSDVDSSRQNPGGGDAHVVTLDTQGAQEWSSLSVLDNQTLVMAGIQTPSKEGFEFLGWSTSPDSFIEWDIEEPVTSDMTLYAVWSGEAQAGDGIYRLTVHLQGGAIQYIAAQRVDIDYRSGKMLRQLPRLNKAPLHSTLEFAAWNTQADGKGEIIYPDTVLTSDLTVYAIWGEPIETVEELAENIECDNPNAVYVLRNATGSYLFSATTLPATSGRWTPLCQDETKPFRGALYGDVYKTSVTRININSGFETTTENIGLFAHVDGAFFTSFLPANYIALADKQYVGALAAKMKNTRLERIGSAVGVVYMRFTGATYGGIIAGYAENITAKDIGGGFNYSPTAKYGGLFGYVKDSVLENIRISGISSGNIASLTDSSYIGGIAGYLDNVTVKEISIGDPTAILNLVANHEGSYIGGIAGYAKDSEIISSNILSVTATANRSGSYAGLIAGKTVNTVVKAAKIEPTSYVSLFGAGSFGGAVGSVEGGSVSEVITYADVIANSSSNAVGGIAGEVISAALNKNLVLAESIEGVTAGAIHGTGSGTVANNHFKAGMAVNSAFPSGGTNIASAVRYKKNFFTDTLGWDFEDIWEMKNYYDFPTLKSENATDFIEISTPAQLAAIGDSFDSMAQAYVLTQDIDLSGYNGGEWIQIGADLNPWTTSFYGKLYGQGYKIKNFRSTPANTNVFPTGIFSSLDGVVKDITFEDVEITRTTGGGVFGTSVASTASVERVHVKGNVANNGFATTISGQVSESSFEGSAKNGGFATTLVGTLKHSYSSGTVNWASTSTTDVNAGGLVATISSTNSAYWAKIISCYSTSAVTVSSTAGNRDSSVGGLAGYVGQYASIQDSYASGDISNTMTLTAANRAVSTGGIAGTLISNVSLNGNIALMSSLIGQNLGSVGIVNTGRIAGIINTSATNVNTDGNLAVSSLAPGGTTSGEEGTDVNTDEAFFRSQGWDMDYLWKWDSVNNRPVFRWQN